MRDGYSLGYGEHSMISGHAVSVATLTALLLLTSTARAAPRRVLVIGGGAPFRDAMSVALGAWDLRVVASEAVPPRPVMPRAADEARVLAQRFDVAGLVWVTTEQNESSLWVYDASTDQVVSRGLATPPPFDAPTAASAALSVKTLLRSSTVAPLDERIGAPPTREAEAPAAPREVAADPGPSPALARLEMGAAARALAGSMDTRLSGGASVWFGAKRNVGVGLVGQFGPGLAVSADRFSGHFAEVSIAPSVRFRVPLARGVTLEPRLGTSLHATSIDGVAVRTSRSASDKRLDGSFDLGIALDFTLSRTLACGVDVSGAAMLRYQRYLVNAEPVFELRQFQGYAGLRLSAEVF